MFKFCWVSLLLIATAHTLPNYTYSPGGDTPSIEPEYYSDDDGISDPPQNSSCTKTDVCPTDPKWISVVADKTACQLHFHCTSIFTAPDIVEEVDVDAIQLKIEFPMFTSLMSYTLYPFQKLVYLEMEFGLITTIEKSAFQRQIELQLLNLSTNQISSISNKAFDGLTRLTTLILQSNNLMSFDDLTFVPLTNLEVLNLNENRITELTNDMFAGLTKLADLKLDHNKISHIGNEALRGMDNLKLLSLKGNLIQSIPNPVLQRTPNIRILRVSYNPINKITKNTLRPIQNTLENLFLNNCNLTTLPKKIFNNYPRLSMLILSKNKFRSLPNLGTAPAMTTLDLNGNALACDDESSPMFRWLRRHKNLTVEATCDTPRSRHNMSLGLIINPPTTTVARGANQGSATTTSMATTTTSTATTTTLPTTTTTTTTEQTKTTTTTSAKVKKPNENASTFDNWNRSIVLTIFAVCTLAIIGLVVLVICKCRRNPNKHNKKPTDDVISLNEQGAAEETTNASSTVVDHLKTDDDDEDEDEGLGSAEKVPVGEDATVEDIEEVTVVIPTVKITNSEDVEVHGGEEQEER